MNRSVLVHMGRALVFAGIVASDTAFAQANPPPASSSAVCDDVAALRLPNSSTESVHEVKEADWPAGVIACEAEVHNHPDDLRLIYQLGRAQDHTGNYIQALHAYNRVVNAGYTEALVDLGSMYYYGHGVVQNYSTAFSYFSKAEQAGSTRAIANLAAMYGDGRGVSKNDAKSLDLAEKAVESGNPFGLKIIADHYFNGAGVPRDYHMAAQYLQQAADLGDGRSMKFLANLYESGYLGTPDPIKAGELRLRAQKVDPEARDPIPAHLPMLKHSMNVLPKHQHVIAQRRYVTYRYNPVWQAEPGDTRCCPNNMLVCPLGRHFCPR